jgi:hypothetical protein
MRGKNVRAEKSARKNKPRTRFKICFSGKFPLPRRNFLRKECENRQKLCFFIASVPRVVLVSTDAAFLVSMILSSRRSPVGWKNR